MRNEAFVNRRAAAARQSKQARVALANIDAACRAGVGVGDETASPTRVLAQSAVAERAFETIQRSGVQMTAADKRKPAKRFDVGEKPNVRSSYRDWQRVFDVGFRVNCDFDAAALVGDTICLPARKVAPCVTVFP